MRIGLDNRVIKYSGIGIYASNLAEHFFKQDNKVYLYDDGLCVKRTCIFDKYFNFLRRLWREQTYVNRWFADNKIDVYHVPKNTGVMYFSDVPVVVTIHDIIPHVFPGKYLSNLLERIYYELAIGISITRSQKIITISEFSKQELIKYYGVSVEKIVVIPLAYNTAFRVVGDKKLLDSVRAKYSISKKYILAIGGSEYRKNIERLISVYQKKFQNQYDLVIIGGKWRNVDLVSKYADEHIKFLTNVPEEDLICIYNLSEVFVFPSFYEGFGIPVLEGMACGVPVVTSNCSSMPEVGGDAAAYFNPYDEEDMAEKIEQVLNDDKLRKNLITKGLAKVKEYSWDKCAEETLRVYRELVCKEWQ